MSPFDGRFRVWMQLRNGKKLSLPQHWKGA